MTHIDLFDGPSWDMPEPHGYEAKPTSRVKGAVEVLGGVALGLAIPACFGIGFLALWGSVAENARRLLG